MIQEQVYRAVVDLNRAHATGNLGSAGKSNLMNMIRYTIDIYGVPLNANIAFAAIGSVVIRKHPINFENGNRGIAHCKIKSAFRQDSNATRCCIEYISWENCNFHVLLQRMNERERVKALYVKFVLPATNDQIRFAKNEGDKTKNYVLKYYAGTVYLEGDVNELLMDLFSCSSSSLSRPKAMQNVYACACVPPGYHDTFLPLNWGTTETIRRPNYPKWTTAPRSSAPPWLGCFPSGCSTMPAPASIAVSRRCTNLLHLVKMLAILFCLFNSSWDQFGSEICGIVREVTDDKSLATKERKKERKRLQIETLQTAFQRQN
uniref:Uncharacterized protein n=1 Tax=Glossina pallidipes TaxID=7398 RepID=A0A1B0A4V1_GLOPL